MLEDKQREFTDQWRNKLQTEEESWLCFDLTRVLWDISKGILKQVYWEMFIKDNDWGLERDSQSKKLKCS